MSPVARPNSRTRQRGLEKLSPSELKEALATLAGAQERASTHALLYAGRGNPNWVATGARDAFFLLGLFAMQACREARDEGQVAGMPQHAGIAARLLRFLDEQREQPGEAFLRSVLRHGTRRLGFAADAFVHELVDGIVGDNYPVPARMLPHVERVVHDYLLVELCGGRPPQGRLDLFAAEGGTAAVCYALDSLVHNGLLAPGDRVAMLQPAFTPYAEIAALERFRFEIVPIRAAGSGDDGARDWHFPDAELAKLADPAVRVLLCVNPGNPLSIALAPGERAAIVRAVRTGNPELVIVPDDAYATVVPGFRSLLADLPEHVIALYSFSKNFGGAGWRLGVIALQEDNVMDRRIAALEPAWQERLARRYGAAALPPQRLRFIDRLVADSRAVALHATAGLSTPQQVQMALFAFTHLLDDHGGYRDATRGIVLRRRDLLWQALGLPLPPPDPDRGWYYVQLDLAAWLRRQHGDAFFAFLSARHTPVDFLFRLAEESGIALLDATAHGGPAWSFHLSLAHLEDADCTRLGQCLRETALRYVDEWRSETAP